MNGFLLLFWLATMGEAFMYLSNNYKLYGQPISFKSFKPSTSKLHKHNQTHLNEVSSSVPIELYEFQSSLSSLAGISSKIQSQILETIQSIGFQTSQELNVFASDFIEMDQPEKLSSVLIQDFNINPLHANYMRAALSHMHTQMKKKEEKKKKEKMKQDEDQTMTLMLVSETNQTENYAQRHSGFRSVVVSEKAKLRQKQRKQKKIANINQKDDYGLSTNDPTYSFPKLSAELEDFLLFMTTPLPSLIQQEPVIRNATAVVYIKHAKQFLGWYLHRYQEQQMSNSTQNPNTVSIQTIIPSKDKSSASLFLQFLIYLRSERHISKSYEANLLRGLLKYMKFRFASESNQSEDHDLNLSYEDIPVIQELRKWHREANKKQALSPRVSEEERKWLEWEEYLLVIQQFKQDVMTKKMEFRNDHPDITAAIISPKGKKKAKSVANLYQRYLILAFFSHVPDRQRTIRELELGKTFYKDHQNPNQYIIKHGPDDYKTGKVYGDRPPLILSSELTSTIDEYISLWRPFLSPKTNSLFVQPRTGNPMTADSIYQIVSRVCYKYAGQRTNPHLLRDMIVTHVRQSSNASEKELEALALYMGHSLAMQRNSYDRRTMDQKVAPAVELLQSVNQKLKRQ